MNKDEILAMPAGREMDALIAKKVMGWTYDDAPRGYRSGWDKPDLHWVAWDDFCPSTDIAAAWEVVEKLHKDYSMELDYDDPQTIEELKWCCSFMLKEEPYLEYESRAGAAPLAICRAALMVVSG